MAKKVLQIVKLQIPGGAASPAPPVGPALGGAGINIPEFCKAFNDRTQGDAGTIIPVEISVFEDRSFTFVTKTPPAAILIKQAISLDKGSPESHRTKVGHLTRDQLRRSPSKDARPQRERHRCGDAGHRRYRPQHGRHRGRRVGDRGRDAEAREALPRGRCGHRARLALRATRRDELDQGPGAQPLRRDRRGALSASASTSVTPISSFAAPSRSRTAPAAEVTVAVFAEGDKAREAEAAGADVVGGADLAKRVRKASPTSTSRSPPRT